MYRILVTLIFSVATVSGVDVNAKTEESLENYKYATNSGAAQGATGQEQYRTSYYFSGHPPPHQLIPATHDWNRDTYSGAAADLGYSGDASQSYGAAAYHPVPMPSYGVDDGYDLDGLGGGIGGLFGLLGLKGLKGLGIIGLLKLGIIPLLFLIVPALILLPLLLLFIPIPVITIPQGRSLGMDIKELGGKVTSLARSVIESDQCIERLSCELSRYGRGTYVDKTLKRVIKKFEAQLPVPVQRMARAYLESTTSGCKKYNCFLMDDTGAATATSTLAKKYKKA